MTRRQATTLFLTKTFNAPQPTSNTEQARPPRSLGELASRKWEWGEWKPKGLSRYCMDDGGWYCDCPDRVIGLRERGACGGDEWLGGYHVTH